LAARVHQLGEDLGPRFMDTVHDAFPALGLGRIRDTGLKEISLAGLVIDIQTFGNQQGEPAVGEPPVVPAHLIRGPTLRCRTHPSHRRQGNTIRQLDITDRGWTKKCVVPLGVHDVLCFLSRSRFGMPIT
jgi:hypothetical protein